MFALTESLPVGLSDILSPPENDGPDFEDTLQRNTDHETSQWFPSARSAIRYALQDAGVESEDEVILPAYTCYAVHRAVESVATPVYADVDRRFTIEHTELERVVSNRTAAIVPVHLYGMTYDVEAIAEFAEKQDLIVIEDAAQAASNLLLSKRVGTYSDYTVLSFRFYKELTAYKGGLLFGTLPDEPSTSESRFDRLKLAGVWSFDAGLQRLPGPVYELVRARLLDPLSRRRSTKIPDTARQSSNSWVDRLLSSQLVELDERVRERRNNASVYRDTLPSSLKQPPIEEDDTVFRYPVLVPDGVRDGLACILRRRGIGVSTMYAYTVAPRGHCPRADRIADEMLNLPVHSDLTRREIKKIAAVVADSWQSLH